MSFNPKFNDREKVIELIKAQIQMDFNRATRQPLENGLDEYLKDDSNRKDFEIMKDCYRRIDEAMERSKKYDN